MTRTVFIPKKFLRTAVGGLIMVSAIALEPYDVIDGVTAASVTHPTAQPTLNLTATPGISGNKIEINSGQTVSIKFSATDPKGYNQYVVVGLVNGNYLYPPNSSRISLPSGATFNNVNNDRTQAVFTWTPSVTSVLHETLTFGAFNTYGSGNSSVQALTITVNSVVKARAENNPPKFTSHNTTHETVFANTPVSLSVTVQPDKDKDAVNINSNDLPGDATLSAAALNSKGLWVSTFNWTPTKDELGEVNVTFIATDANETASRSLTTKFNVESDLTPSFASPASQTVVVGQTLVFPVTVNPDAYTTKVAITPTHLPKGATLGSPKLVNGQVVANLTWTPSKNEANHQYKVIFTAEDQMTGARPVTQTVHFTVKAK